MFRKLGHEMICLAPDDGGSGGGGSSNNTDDNNDDNNNNDNNDDNNDDDPNKFEITPNFWQSKTQEPENNNNNNNNTNNDNNEEKNNATAFQEHVNSLNFGDLEMSQDDISNFVSTGDMKGLTTAITKHGQSVYSKVMQDTSVLIKQNRQNIMDEVRAEISSASGEKDNLVALHNAIEVTKNPAVQPVAIAVMKQAMSKSGVTQAQGIEAVRQFFKAVRTDDGAGPDQSQPGDTSFRGNKGEDIDWAKELAAI